MRPWEAALSGANLVAVLVFAIPWFGRQRWAQFLLAVPLAIAVVQVLIEGIRWQMVLGYATAAMVPLVWFLRRVWAGRIAVRRWIARTGAVAGIAAGAVLLLVSVALPVIVPVFHFSAPTGRFGIGTVTYHWVDASRAELFTADPADRRELMAQVWYPAGHDPGAPRAEYLPDADVVTPALARLTGMPPFLFSHFRYVTTNAAESAPIATEQASYPVLVFLSGMYGFRSVSTFQIEELVSHGYIVVGLDQPGVVAMVRYPDGRQIENLPFDQIDALVDQSVEPEPIAPSLHGVAQPLGVVPYFAEDVGFTLDQLASVNAADPRGILTSHLDLDRAGTFGVSLGGRIAAQACLNDARLKACLVMDDPAPADVVSAGLHQPTMFLTRDADTMRLERRRSGGWTEHDIAMTLDTMRAAFAKLTGGGYYVEVPNLFHVNFTDLPYWLEFSSQFGLTGPIRDQRGFAIINAYTVAFFDQAVRGQASALLDEASQQIPEASIHIRPPAE